MRNFSNGIDIRNVGVRITQRLNVNGLGIFLNGVLNFRKIMRVHKRRGNAEQRKRMCKQVGCAAVNGFLCDDVFALLCKCL